MKLKEKIILAFVLIGIIALSRIIPHYPNFTALGAAALFAGAKFGRKALAFALPFLALFLSDLLLNNFIYNNAFPAEYNGFTFFKPDSLWIYAAFAGIVLIGMFGLKKLTPGRTLGASVSASVLFFVVTNFGVWATGSLYPLTFEGLIASYTAAIPFFWNTVLGDLFYVAVLFGGYALAATWLPRLQPVKEKSQ